MVHRLRPLALLAALGTLGAGATLVVACTGKVSNGKVSSTSQPVSLGAISGTPAACPSGSAHPNACCETSAGQAASCVVYPGAPFTQCAGGATTYPDPRTCCPLDGNGACEAPPPPPADDAGPGPGDPCAYACPVGWYTPPGPTPTPNGGGSSGGTGGGSGGGVTCCETNPDGSGQCMGFGSAGSGCGCACPGCDPDSGVCPPCPPCNCPPTPPPGPPSCGQCPPGWQVPQGDPLLCCQTAPDGTIDCFSQGVPPPPPGQPDDAGPAQPPASCFGGGGGSPDGSTFTQCGCSETVNGTDYTVTCTDPGATCSCSTGGANGTTSGPVPEPSTQCNDLAALFAACNFPH
jgi:hypothetical protein